MVKSKATWKKGQSGNPKGRPVGTGRVDEYRQLLDPHVPALLKVLLGKAKKGDLWAIRLILERVYPVRDAALADIMTNIEELRAMIEARKPADPEGELAGLLREVETLRRQVQQGSMQ